jgi:hypothetical protein
VHRPYSGRRGGAAGTVSAAAAARPFAGDQPATRCPQYLRSAHPPARRSDHPARGYTGRGNSGESVAMAGRPANLKPWRPGESGNPSGRPRGASITAAIRRELEIGEGDDLSRSQATQIARRLIEVAQDPSHPQWSKAVTVILDRIDGPVSREVIAPSILPPKVIRFGERPVASDPSVT